MKQSLIDLLKKLRKDKGLTMQQAADLVCSTKGYISQVESGKKECTLSWVEKYVDALGYEIELNGKELEG